MKNIIDYIKDKIYYILGATIIIIVVLLLVSSCSGKSKSYSSIENDMVSAAKNYYANHKSNLPKEEGDLIKVTIGTLIDYELLEEVKDPNNKNQTCSGYVEVTKVGDEYAYTPFLTCKGNYEPEYLVDKIKNSKLDEYGNGVYEMDGEYVYRGDDVNNYLKFNNQIWRIVKIDDQGDVKIVLAEYTENSYSWDSSYNSESGYNTGITTNYLNTQIRKTLKSYYEDNFSKESKSKIVSKNLCVGRYSKSDNFSVEKECSILKEAEKIGLLNASDYKNASLDQGCNNIDSIECSNYNYLASDGIKTWLLNASSENTYKVYNLSKRIYLSNASNQKRINPVIYITNKSITMVGKGTIKEPYEIK
ncbi:MAG: hypothetical protein ACI4U0_00240 [Candidatus Aphodocola sp.]